LWLLSFLWAGAGCSTLPSASPSPDVEPTETPLTTISTSPTPSSSPVATAERVSLTLKTEMGPLVDKRVDPDAEFIEAWLSNLKSPEGSVLKAIWRADFGDLHEVESLKLTGRDDSKLFKLDRPAGGWESGDYSLFLFVDGKVLKTGRFRVGKTWQQEAPKPNFRKRNRGFADPRPAKGALGTGEDRRTKKPLALVTVLSDGKLRLELLFGEEMEVHLLTPEQWGAFSEIAQSLKDKTNGQELAKESNQQFELELDPGSRTVRIALVGVQGALQLPAKDFFEWVASVDSSLGVVNVPLLDPVNEPNGQELHQLSGANLTPIRAKRDLWWPSVVRDPDNEVFVLLRVQSQGRESESSLLLTEAQWRDTVELINQGMELTESATEPGRTPIPSGSSVPFHLVVHVLGNGERELELSRHELDLTFAVETFSEIQARLQSVSKELVGQPQWPRWAYDPDLSPPNRITYDSWNVQKKDFLPKAVPVPGNHPPASISRTRLPQTRPKLEEAYFLSGDQRSEHFAVGQETIHLNLRVSSAENLEVHLWSPDEVRTKTATTKEPEKVVFKFQKPNNGWAPGFHRAIIYADGVEVGYANFTVWEPEALLSSRPELVLSFHDQEDRPAQVESLPSNISSFTVTATGDLPVGVPLTVRLTEPSGAAREVDGVTKLIEGDTTKLEPMGMSKEFVFQSGPGRLNCRFDGPFPAGEYEVTIMRKDSELDRDRLYVRDSEERLYPETRLLTNERRAFEIRLPKDWEAVPDPVGYGDWSLYEKDKPKWDVRTKLFKVKPEEDLRQAALRILRLDEQDLNSQGSLKLGPYQVLEFVYRGGSYALVIPRHGDGGFALVFSGSKQFPKERAEKMRAMMKTVRFPSIP